MSLKVNLNTPTSAYRQLLRSFNWNVCFGYYSVWWMAFYLFGCGLNHESRKEFHFYFLFVHRSTVLSIFILLLLLFVCNIDLVFFFVEWQCTFYMKHYGYEKRITENELFPGRNTENTFNSITIANNKCLCVDRIWLYVVVVSRFLLHNFGNDMRILVFRWNAWECMFRVSFRSISASSSSSSTVMHHLIRLLNFIPRFRGMEWY